VHNVLIIVGAAIAIIGGFGILIAAFRTGILWGLACFFIPGAALFFLIAHWEDAKNSFFLNIVGVLIIVAGTSIAPPTVPIQ